MKKADRKLCLLPLVVAAVLLKGCSGESAKSASGNLDALTDTVYASQLEVVIDVESQLLAQPVEVQVLDDDRIAVLDMILHRVKIFDRDGNYLFEFGGEGRGPGEWTNTRYFGANSDRFVIKSTEELLFNFYDADGNFTTALPYDAKFRNEHLYLTDDNRLIMEADGEEGALALVLDLSDPGSEWIPIGKAMADPVEVRFDLSIISEQLAAGEIPDYIVNRAIVTANDEGIALLMTSLGDIKFYSHAGDELWSVRLPAEITEPHQADVIERNSNTQPGTFSPLEYGVDIKMDSDRIYLLTMPGEQIPQSLLVYSMDGELIRRRVITGDDSSTPYFVATFDVTSDGALLFPDLTGRIVKMYPQAN